MWLKEMKIKRKANPGLNGKRDKKELRKIQVLITVRNKYYKNIYNASGSSRSKDRSYFQGVGDPVAEK